MKEMPKALASRNFEENQAFMRVLKVLAAEFGFARRLRSETRRQVLDNMRIRRDAVSAIS